ncbi:MAG: inorganic pyrophosphatase [Alphaproteobacteria bacterium]|nr:MAG: inorganic pyrophosphatase [Alphaproteobacteria bacterium]
MDYKVLPPGNKVPEEVNAIVEIPKGEGRKKYEYRLNGMLIIDRLRGADQPPYPTHYCGIPATQASDGDPLDVLILGDDKLMTGDVIAVRPVAVFWMSDEKGIDPKIIAVPADSVSDEYRHIQTLADVPEADRKAIETFFGEYKKGDLAGKYSTSGGWDDIDVAHRTIHECIDRWNNASANPVPAKSQAPKP